MAIFGTSHLSDAGDLLIFNKLSHKTLLMFEKELGRDRITYLVEEALPPDAAIAAHLESTKADGILFRAETSDPIALRAAIMERINQGRRVVFLPGPVAHIKGSICQIPPRVMKTLGALAHFPRPGVCGFLHQLRIGCGSGYGRPGGYPDSHSSQAGSGEPKWPHA